MGSAAAVAFVGATDSVVRFNTIYRPGRWALRILQETRAPGFVPCRKGEFTDNLVVFEAEGWGGAVNVGPGTEPETFTFARNVWYAADRPGSSRPQLPDGRAGRRARQGPHVRRCREGRLRPARRQPCLQGRGDGAAEVTRDHVRVAGAGR